MTGLTSISRLVALMENLAANAAAISQGAPICSFVRNGNPTARTKKELIKQLRHIGRTYNIKTTFTSKNIMGGSNVDGMATWPDCRIFVKATLPRRALMSAFFHEIAHIERWRKDGGHCPDYTKKSWRGELRYERQIDKQAIRLMRTYYPNTKYVPGYVTHAAIDMLKRLWEKAHG